MFGRAFRHREQAEDLPVKPLCAALRCASALLVTASAVAIAAPAGRDENEISRILVIGSLMEKVSCIHTHPDLAGQLRTDSIEFERVVAPVYTSDELRVLEAGMAPSDRQYDRAWCRKTVTRNLNLLQAMAEVLREERLIDSIRATMGDRRNATGVGLGDGSLTVRHVIPNSPADKAGIKEGDVIAAVHGKHMLRGSQFLLAVLEARPGDSLPITVIRALEVLRLDVGVVPANQLLLPPDARR